MHIWHDKRPETGAAPTAGLLLALLAAGLAGCASPGPPLPPSLKLPAVVDANGLTATRVGDTVELHWTTPTRTTDKLLITGTITAVICRDTPPASPAARVPCSAVQREEVVPGPSDAVDSLPAALAAGSPRLLVYRVQLLNAAGHTAGPSAPVFAAAGRGPAPIADFRGDPAKAGALLRWHADAGSSDAVELTRTTVEVPASSATPRPAAPERNTGLLGDTKEPAIARFRASAPGSDPGGTLDRTAQIGHTYTYSVQRVRTVQLGTQTLELRSAPSPAVRVAVRDIFPPEIPTGLVAVPAFAGEGAAPRPVIDLSWEPDVEPRLAGYRVYRRQGDASAWQRLTADLQPTAAYRDATVTAGHTYTYRVTAVSDAGNESAPSLEITETAPMQ